MDHTESENFEKEPEKDVQVEKEHVVWLLERGEEKKEK